MKARVGFVTNSSSVNFTAWGLENIEKSMIKDEILDKIDENKWPFFNERLKELSGLEVNDADGSSDLAIGREITSEWDEEITFKIKQEIVNSLNKILKEPISIGDIQYIDYEYIG